MDNEREIAVPVKRNTTSRKVALENFRENEQLLVVNALTKNPVAKVLFKYLDKEARSAIVMTSKALDAAYHPLVKKYIYYKANVGELTEDEVRANMHLVNIRVDNLRIYEGEDFNNVRPFFEHMGENMKKLQIMPQGVDLNIHQLCSVLTMVPNLEHVEIHTENLSGGGQLAACKQNLPILQRVETIYVRYSSRTYFHSKGKEISDGCWHAEAIKAFVDLLFMCPNLKQIMFFKFPPMLFEWSHKFLVRYTYLRTGIVLDYNNMTRNDWFVYFPVRRNNSFSIQNFGEEWYLQRFIRSRDLKPFDEYSGDKHEWKKANVRFPPCFLEALSDTDKQRCIAKGFQFADVNHPTQLFGLRCGKHLPCCTKIDIASVLQYYDSYSSSSSGSSDDEEDEMKSCRMFSISSSSSDDEDKMDPCNMFSLSSEDESGNGHEDDKSNGAASAAASDDKIPSYEKRLKMNMTYGREIDDEDLGERVKYNCPTQ